MLSNEVSTIAHVRLLFLYVSFWTVRQHLTALLTWYPPPYFVLSVLSNSYKIIFVAIYMLYRLKLHCETSWKRKDIFRPRCDSAVDTVYCSLCYE